jgi:broad specificity phosphatase PhoE
LKAIAGKHPGQRVVCVAHGGAMSMAMGHILDGDYSQWKRILDNCSVAEIAFTEEPELLCFNEAWD